MPTISVHGKMPSRAEARKYEEARKYQEELASSQRSTAHGEDRSKSGYLSELRSILVMEDRGHKEYLEGLRQHVKDMKALQSKGGMPFGSQGAAAFSNQVRAASAAAFGVRGRKGGGTSYPSSRITREGYDARIFGTPIERYHAGDVELSARQRRQQAEAENRDFDRRMKARRGFEAQRKREEDARYRKDRAEAEHKNNDMKLIARKQESERQKDAQASVPGTDGTCCALGRFGGTYCAVLP